MTDENSCLDCGGRCCSFRRLNIAFGILDRGERYDSHLIEMWDEGVEQLVTMNGELADMRWFVVTVDHEDGDHHRYIAFECEHLEDGLYSIYEDRPGMCRDFECDVLEGEAELGEFVEENGFDGGLPENRDAVEVTERANEILKRRAAP